VADIARTLDRWPADREVRSVLAPDLLSAAVHAETAHRAGADETDAIPDPVRARLGVGLRLDPESQDAARRAAERQAGRLEAVLERIEETLDRIAESESARALAAQRWAAVAERLAGAAVSGPTVSVAGSVATMALLQWLGVPVSELWPLIRALLAGW